MFKKLLFLTIISCFYSNSYAQTLEVDENEVSHWEANFLAGLNSNGWQAEFGCAYFPIQYVGFKANLGFAGEIKEFGDWGLDDEETGHSYATRFKFNPSLVLRTPSIVTFDNNARIYFFTEGGIILSPGASGSDNAKICSWDAKCGINYQKGRLILFGGYGITNFTLYSGIPDYLVDNDNKFTHSGFIGTAYKF